jgi:hypothetical protein
MTCKKCAHVVERTDVPHVVRNCEDCGREMRIHEPGHHGIGFRVRTGDRVSIPQAWLQLSLNPLRSVGQFSRSGLTWYAGLIHLEDIPKKRSDIRGEIARLTERCDQVITGSPLLEGLDPENPEHAQSIVERLKARQDSAEWWAFALGNYASILQDALERSDAEQVAWATACVERCRAMLMFKEHMEEVVWMGQSAKRIVDILRTWDNNEANDDEGFWQITFRENSYAISQVFACPLIFIKDAAYVGGMNIDRQNAKLVDYLFSNVTAA